MNLSENFKTKALWAVCLVSFGYMLFLGYRSSLKHLSPPSYFSGVLVYEDYLRCGLMKTRNMDHMSCQFRGEVCSELRNLSNRRIRIMGQKVPCTEGSDFQCSMKGQFNESSFDGTYCFRDYEIAKIFPEGDSPPDNATEER